MQLSTLDTRRAERGFTLVELAIVLVIVGLLIGGILKGQELITNSRATTTVTQLKAIEAAAYTFRDTYQSIPGDIQNAQNRVPNCAAADCAATGDGDGVLDNTPSVASNAYNVEGTLFFIQLGAAGLVDGIGAPAAGAPAVGAGLLATKLGNDFTYRAGSATLAANLAGAVAVDFRAGTYVAIAAQPGTAIAAGSAANAIIPNVASRIDGKLDDGFPNAGSMRASGTVAAAPVATTCILGTSIASDVYATSISNGNCALFTRVLQ